MSTKSKKNDYYQLTKGYYSGADLGFSRGGGGADFQKIFENFVDLFFRSTKLIFRALPKHCFVPIFGYIFCAAGKILKKQAKNGVFRHFLEIIDQKIAFFRRALPPQNEYTLAPKVPLEKF